MKKKIYNTPQCEVVNIPLGGPLMSSPTDSRPVPPVAPAPPRNADYLS